MLLYQIIRPNFDDCSLTGADNVSLQVTSLLYVHGFIMMSSLFKAILKFCTTNHLLKHSLKLLLPHHQFHTGNKDLELHEHKGVNGNILMSR